MFNNLCFDEAHEANLFIYLLIWPKIKALFDKIHILRNWKNSGVLRIPNHIGYWLRSMIFKNTEKWHTLMLHCFKLGSHLLSSKCCAYVQIRAIWQKSVSWREFLILNSDFDFKQSKISCYIIYQLVGMIEALLLILEYPSTYLMKNRKNKEGTFGDILFLQMGVCSLSV